MRLDNIVNKLFRVTKIMKISRCINDVTNKISANVEGIVQFLVEVVSRDTYQKMFNLGNNCLKNNEKEEAIKYFNRALKRKARKQTYERSADYFVLVEEDKLADKFYEKLDLEEKLEQLGKKCLRLGSKKLGEKYLSRAANNAESFKKYLEIYGLLLRNKEYSNVQEQLLDKLKSFSKQGKENYRHALDYVQTNFELDEVYQFSKYLIDEKIVEEDKVIDYIEELESKLAKIQYQGNKALSSLEQTENF
jgi:uncharacterized protein HemY